MSSDENKNPTLLKLTTAFLTSCTFSTVAPIKSPNSLSRWRAQRPSLLNGALRNSPLKGLPLKQRNVTRWRSVRDHNVTSLNHDQSTTQTIYKIQNSIYLIVLIFLSLLTTSDLYILLQRNLILFEGQVLVGALVYCLLLLSSTYKLKQFFSDEQLIQTTNFDSLES